MLLNQNCIAKAFHIYTGYQHYVTLELYKLCDMQFISFLYADLIQVTKLPVTSIISGRRYVLCNVI